MDEVRPTSIRPTAYDSKVFWPARKQCTNWYTAIGRLEFKKPASQPREEEQRAQKGGTMASVIMQANIKKDIA